MWKLAIVSLLCLSAGFVGAGRLRRSEDEGGCVDGSDCDEGFECVEGACSCPPTGVLVEGGCLRLATEAENRCQVREQCRRFDGAVCSREECVGVKGFGDRCNFTLECNRTLSLTCAGNVCQCPPERVKVEGLCLPRATALGDACRTDAECEGLKASCENGTCQSANATAGPCEDENAILLDGACACKENYIEEGGTCLREAANLGEGCVSTRQCERVNGTCEGGVCAEVATPIAPPPPPPVVSSDCAADEDCAGVRNALCKEAICQCREGYLPSEDMSECLPMARKPGDDCRSPKQCAAIPNSSCLDGKCVVVAAAGVKTRGRNGGAAFAVASKVLTSLLVISSRAVFG